MLGDDWPEPAADTGNRDYAVFKHEDIFSSNQKKIVIRSFLSAGGPAMIFCMETTTIPTSPHRRERTLNRRLHGDIGELSAMEWLASRGATVWTPSNHSPHVDLMAEGDDQLIRVQVKTSTYRGSKPESDRWNVSIATNGGNRSWNGVAKRFDPGRVDYLFVLVGDGRRWFIPARLVEGSRGLVLGGPKYSEFEIERGTPFEGLVYGDAAANKLPAAPPLPGECQSGQMEQTVNLPAMPTQVRILPPPSSSLRSSRQILLRPKRQATFPKAPCEEAGISPGDRLWASSDGPGRVVFAKIDAATADATPTEAPV
jgi:PD-(D/E)XK endonuclease